VCPHPLTATRNILLLSGSTPAQATDEQDVRTISKSIKTLANAVELWANAHQGKYPTSREFYSDEFLKYVKKVDPAEAKNNLCCTLSGRSFIYQRLQAEKNFIVSCPRPIFEALPLTRTSRAAGPKRGCSATGWTCSGRPGDRSLFP